ncbi:hypothetical protein Golomagni_06011 [Golovinomyces magnicellulatus]|nr:hypothetical protein Golomagni_06011 [Golovinomyces magnicellulatus]
MAPRTPLSIAVSCDNEIDLVKVLLEHGANPNHLVDDRTMLHNAIDNGDENVAKLLLQHGADHRVLNEHGTNALQHAAQADFKELVDLITQKDSSVNEATEGGWSPLMMAVDDGYANMVALLLEKGADINYATENSWPALTIAASKGNMDILTMLLDHGADIDQSDPAGWCPLLIAIAYEQDEAATVLLQRGAKPDVQTSSGDTAFAIASEKGVVDIMDNLWNAITIDVNRQNELGRSALHGAAMRGQTASVDFLLSLDSPPTATLKDVWEATPLVLAIRNGHADVVQKLVDKSGSLLSKDALGHDAFYWASQCCNGSVMKILKSTPEGAEIHDAVKEDDTEKVEFNPDTCFCDVCGRTSTCQPKYSPKKCLSCRWNGEAMAICEFCIRDGAKCLGNDHEWVPHICTCGDKDEEDDDDDDDDRSTNNPSSWGYGSSGESNSGSDQDSDNESDQASDKDSENESDQSD